MATGWAQGVERPAGTPDAPAAPQATPEPGPDACAETATTTAAARAGRLAPAAHAPADAVRPHSVRCSPARCHFFFLRLCAQHHQDGMGQERQRDMAVPGAKAAHLILVESHFAFGFFKAFLDFPTAACHAHQLRKPRLSGTCRPVVP